MYASISSASSLSLSYIASYTELVFEHTSISISVLPVIPVYMRKQRCLDLIDHKEIGQITFEMEMKAVPKVNA